MANLWSRSHKSSLTLQFQELASLNSDPIVSMAIYHISDGNLGGLELNGQVCSKPCVNLLMYIPIENFSGGNLAAIRV